MQAIAYAKNGDAVFCAVLEEALGKLGCSRDVHRVGASRKNDGSWLGFLDSVLREEKVFAIS